MTHSASTFIFIPLHIILSSLSKRNYHQLSSNNNSNTRIFRIISNEARFSCLLKWKESRRDKRIVKKCCRFYLRMLKKLQNWLRMKRINKNGCGWRLNLDPLIRWRKLDRILCSQLCQLRLYFLSTRLHRFLSPMCSKSVRNLPKQAS